MSIGFTPTAWSEYLRWQDQDKRTLKKINEWLKDVLRNPFDGIGQPEQLKNDLTGYWSRRVDKKNRLIYKMEGEHCLVVQCRGHYSDH